MPIGIGTHDDNPYFAFTDACNDVEPAAVMLASGQACVWYRLTLASKDGDWILREEPWALERVLDRLAAMGARYRMGAPLALPWLRAGWSSHFEALGQQGERLRFDFVSRPPRLSPADLARCWAAVDAGSPPVLPQLELIAIKRTMRLKDYAFIGALAVQLADPREQLLHTLDAQHLLDLLCQHPDLADQLAVLRPSLADTPREPDAVAAAIDRDIRMARRQDEERLQRYTSTLQPWSEHFRKLDLHGLGLHEAHRRLCTAADGRLPTEIPDHD